MFGLATKKGVKKSFKKFKEEIKELKKELVSKSEIELMIENKILKLREPSSRTPREPQTKIRKKVNNLLNKAEIMQEMQDMEQKGLSTTEMLDIVVNQKKIVKKTCFYKYLRLVRQSIPRTPRTELRTN